MNKFIMVFFLTLLVQSAWSKEDETQKILNYAVRATNFTRSYPPHEKVYLHMDNSSYFLDETLWYKAYVVDSDSNRLTKASEILHLDLLTPEGAVIRTQKQRLIDGQCDGYFTLDSALYSGYFEIRAYTKAMLNYDEQNYFSRVFPIFEKPNKIGEFDSIRRTLPRSRVVGDFVTKELVDMEKRKNPDYIVNFYPEGGDLIVDTKANVAFQIKDSYGQIVNKTCYLWSNDGEIVDSVFSTHLGLGVFKFTPERKRTGYYVTIKGDLKKSKFQLPKALSSGHSLSVDNLSDSVQLIVRVESTIFNDVLGVAVLSRGCTGFSDVIKPKKNKPINTFSIEKTTLREGVNQVVLYDKDGRELSSRMVFIRNGVGDDVLTIDAKVKSEDDALKPYERQSISFQIKDSKGKGVETNFSVSIYDSTSHSPTFCKDNIYTNLLLSSEVKGFIPNVDYYFESDDYERRANLDMLLRVYGWSRYKWEYLSGYEKMENPYFLEKGLSLYGSAYGRRMIWQGGIDTMPDLRGRYIPTDENVRLLGTKGVSIIGVYNDSLLFTDRNKKSASLYWYEDLFPRHKSVLNNRGQFYLNFGDFYGEIKLFLTSLDSRIRPAKEGRRYFDSYFLIDSEKLPEEKEYDYFETIIPDEGILSPYAIINGEYISQFSIDEIGVVSVNNRVFHPSIKTKYYNQGFDSDIYPAFSGPILDRVYNKTFSSFQEYEKRYNLDNYNLYYKSSRGDYITPILWKRGQHIAFPTEYLNYYKLPLGSVAFISNTTVDTTRVKGDRSYFVTPLRSEVIDISNYNMDESKYKSFVDSTVIHTDRATIDSIHNRFKDHSDYKQYLITNKFEAPGRTSDKERPMYVVEHFCRIVKQYTRRILKVEMGDTLTMFEGNAIRDFKPIKIIYRKNNKSQVEHIKRVITFQGLTPLEREFYSPDYSKLPLPEQGDYRRTLYWNPNVKTDRSGKAKVEFYNNSTCEKYYIDVQTLSSSGEIGVLKK